MNHLSLLLALGSAAAVAGEAIPAPAAGATNFPPKLTVQELLADKERWHSNRVEVSGYYASHFELSAIYSSEVDMLTAQDTRSVWIWPWRQGVAPDIKPGDRLWVRVVGVFRVPQRGGCGHFGQWPAELVEVELLEPQARPGREEEGRVADGASPVPEAVTRPPELTLPQLLAGLSNGVVPLGGDLGFAVRLPAGLADEKSLRLLATWAPLRELTLTCDPASNEPSAPAIQALQGASGLLSLTLQCCGYLPDGCLEALGSLQQISSLTLIDAIPREGCTYGYLTNARALRSLAISFPREFGPTEVAALRELLQVQDLRLFRAKPPESHYWPLLKLPGLTNLLVELPASRLEVRRTREDK